MSLPSSVAWRSRREEGSANREGGSELDASVVVVPESSSESSDESSGESSDESSGDSSNESSGESSGERSNTRNSAGRSGEGKKVSREESGHGDSRG